MYIFGCIQPVTAHMSTPEPADVTKFEFFPFSLSLLITLSIGFSASLFTRPEIKGWYQHIQKPGFTPPPWLFAPVWTLLYILMAVAAYLIWKRRNASNVYLCSKAYHFIQLLLNFLWSVTFFKLHQINLALAVIILLMIGIGGSMYYFSKVYKAAAWLLLPYLFWVAYATALNLSISLLN